MTAINCPDEGRWRAFMDRELPVEDQAALAEHLAGCPACRVTLQALRGDAEACAAAMAQVQVPTPPITAAWLRFAAGQPAAAQAGAGRQPASDDLWGSLVVYVSGFLRDTRRRARYGLRTLSWRLDTMSRNSQLRWQPALAAILVVAVLISAVTTRSAASAGCQRNCELRDIVSNLQLRVRTP